MFFIFSPISGMGEGVRGGGKVPEWEFAQGYDVQRTEKPKPDSGMALLLQDFADYVHSLSNEIYICLASHVADSEDFTG